MIYNAPKIENKSIYEVLRLTGQSDFDICDNVWDWGVNVGCCDNLEKCGDYYDKFMLLFCLNVICTKYQPKWYSCCNVVDFIEQNRKAIDKFLNEENLEDYQPQNYEELNCDEDSGYFEVYMESLEQLINGNYSERQYEKLYKYLGGK